MGLAENGEDSAVVDGEGDLDIAGGRDAGVRGGFEALYGGASLDTKGLDSGVIMPIARGVAGPGSFLAGGLIPELVGVSGVCGSMY